MPPPVNRYLAMQHPYMTQFEKVITIDADAFAYNQCKFLPTMQKIEVPLAMSNPTQGTLPGKKDRTVKELLEMRQQYTLLRKIPTETYLEKLAQLCNIPINQFYELTIGKPATNGIMMFWHKKFFTNPDWINFTANLYQLTHCESDEFNLNLFFLNKHNIPTLTEVGLPKVDRFLVNLRPDSLIIHPWAGNYTMEESERKKILHNVFTKILGGKINPTALPL